MPDAFLDTNIIIRYITQDEPDQGRRALEYLAEVETGQRTVTTCEGVIIEAVQVLASPRTYALPRREVVEKLTDLLDMRGLQLPAKQAYIRALELYYEQNVDFVDALAVAHMERAGITTIISFDRDFNRFPQITRQEP